jgi:hypothetical protein
VRTSTIGAGAPCRPDPEQAHRRGPLSPRSQSRREFALGAGGHWSQYVAGFTRAGLTNCPTAGAVVAAAGGHPSAAAQALPSRPRRSPACCVATWSRGLAHSGAGAPRSAASACVSSSRCRSGRGRRACPVLSIGRDGRRAWWGMPGAVSQSRRPPGDCRRGAISSGVLGGLLDGPVSGGWSSKDTPRAGRHVAGSAVPEPPGRPGRLR